MASGWVHFAPFIITIEEEDDDDDDGDADADADDDADDDADAGGDENNGDNEGEKTRNPDVPMFYGLGNPPNRRRLTVFSAGPGSNPIAGIRPQSPKGLASFHLLPLAMSYVDHRVENMYTYKHTHMYI